MRRARTPRDTMECAKPLVSRSSRLDIALVLVHRLKIAHQSTRPTSKERWAMRELISVAHFLWPIHIHHKLKMSGKVRFSRVLAVIGRHAAGLKWPQPVCLPGLSKGSGRSYAPQSAA